MALAMRLSRGGSKKRPYYKIVVADARSPRDGKFIERIGSYNPLLPKDSEERVKLDGERAKHWLDAGAQPSDRVSRFLDAAGIRERKARNNPNKGKPGEKATERAEERATREADAKEAAEAAKSAPAEEAPKDEEVKEAETEAVVAEVVEKATAEEAPADEAKADEPAAEEKPDEAAVEEKPAEAAADEKPAEEKPVEEAKSEG